MCRLDAKSQKENCGKSLENSLRNCRFVEHVSKTTNGSQENLY